MTVLSGVTYMTGNLIQLDLAARICPPKAAGTVFALLMSVSNLGILLSTWVGGIWYDQLDAGGAMMRPSTPWSPIGAAFTAVCWLLMPWLRPE